MIVTTRAYREGEEAGYKYGMFNRRNPYNPLRMPREFHEWEAGFSKGYQRKEWL